MKEQFKILLELTVFVFTVILTACDVSTDIHQHTYSEEWAYDKTNHWHAAICGHDEKDGEAAHIFGEWETVEPVTEGVDGSKKRTCSVCKYEQIEVIPALSHQHTYFEEWTHDETNHWHAAKCGCGDEERKDVGEHTFGNLVTTTEAQDHINGEGYYQCSTCKYEKKVEIPSIKYAFIKGRTVDGATNVNVDNTVFTEGRTVVLRDFYIGRYEVTQAEYESVMKGQKVTVGETEYELNSTPSSFNGSDSSKIYPGDIQENRPVERVTWYDAVWYCNALSIKEGLDPAYEITVKDVDDTGYITDATVVFNKEANGYRLPTEAEWEFAARGGDQSAPDWNYKFSGAPSNPGEHKEIDYGMDLVGWYEHNALTGNSVLNTIPYSGYTHEVGKKAPNRLGLYDMSGNVSEWCFDYVQHTDREPGTVYDPVIEEERKNSDGSLLYGPGRIWRGGSWDVTPTSVYGGGNNGANIRQNNKGFRVARYAE